MSVNSLSRQTQFCKAHVQRFSISKDYFGFVGNGERILPKGLRLMPNFLSNDQANRLVAEMKPFFKLSSVSPEFNRSIFNFHSRSLKMQPEIHKLAEQLSRTEGWKANSAQLNHYQLPDWSCPFHVDASSVGPNIAMFSFLSSCVLSLKPVEKFSTRSSIEVLLEPNSLIILNDEARNDYEHGIQFGSFQFLPFSIQSSENLESSKNSKNLENSKNSKNSEDSKNSIIQIPKKERISLVLWETLNHPKDFEFQDLSDFESKSIKNNSLADRHQLIDLDSRKF